MIFKRLPVIFLVTDLFLYIFLTAYCKRHNILLLKKTFLVLFYVEDSKEFSIRILGTSKRSRGRRITQTLDWGIRPRFQSFQASALHRRPWKSISNKICIKKKRSRGFKVPPDSLAAIFIQMPNLIALINLRSMFSSGQKQTWNQKLKTAKKGVKSHYKEIRLGWELAKRQAK